MRIVSPYYFRYQHAVDKLQYILIAFVPLLFSLSFHEAAHAWAADKLGDPTAKYMGRLTLNPTAHIDIFGTVILPLICMFSGVGFIGWAKPVPVNERNLRRGYKDGLLVAAAGPASNLILAVAFTVVLYVMRHSGIPGSAEQMAGLDVMIPLQMMVTTAIRLNVLLAIFNLIPLPPLDGSRVLGGLIPALAPQLAMIERYGFFVFILLFMTHILDLLVFLPSHVIYSTLLSWAY